jgi:hypothetical protein
MAMCLVKHRDNFICLITITFAAETLAHEVSKDLFVVANSSKLLRNVLSLATRNLAQIHPPVATIADKGLSTLDKHHVYVL